MQRRERDQRLQTVLAVTAQGPHEVMRGHTENLSRGGLFVATDNPLEPGMELDLSLVFPEIGAVVQVIGVVRWVRAPATSRPGGMGIEFSEVGAQADSVLARFLRHSQDSQD